MSSAHSPVLKIEGPPGSGKTHELAREACRLIVEDGYSARQVLLLGATPLGKKRLIKELAAEAKLAGRSGDLPQVNVLDRWLLSILKEFSSATSNPVSLLSDTEARIILQEVLREVVPAGHGLHYAVRRGTASRFFLGLLQQLQMQGLSAADVQAKVASATLEDPRLPLVAEIYRQFEQRTQAGNLLCYAQLAHRVLALLTSSLGVRTTLQARYAVLLLDEAQELSAHLYRILALLGTRLVLAGNEKLSIRQFRGAEPEQFKTLSAYAGGGDRTASPWPVTHLPRQACFRGNEAILSLLNNFLPQPIWEAQAVDSEQLKQTVKFGYFADPQQEAVQVAERIASFVRDSRVTERPDEGVERPARWSDCVVLLRSSRYRSHLLEAFQQRGIPFQWQALSEPIIRLQHGIYDLLKVQLDWQDLGITPALLAQPDELVRHWAERLSFAEEQALWIAENNRHLLRGLETLLLTEEQTGALRHLSASQTTAGEVEWLLPELCGLETVPSTLAQAILDLLALFGQLYQSGSALALVEALFELLTERLASDPDFKILTEGFIVFQSNVSRLNAHYQASFGKPLPLAETLENFQALWDGAETNQAESSPQKPQDSVRILSLHEVQGEEFPLVLIPFLVSGEFPYTRELPELLSPDAEAVLGFSSGYQIEEAEEARLLAVGMSRATHQVVLSSHAQDGTELILPSPFYTALLNGKRQLMDQDLHAWICQCGPGKNRDEQICSVDYCSESLVSLYENPDAVALAGMLDRFTGDSVWANLELQPQVPLFEAEEVLNISASSIKTYMQCPRQFYYKHLLRLPQPSSDVAALGTLIHRVMEVFNRQAGQIPHTAQSLAGVAESLFLFDSDEEGFYAAGFEDKDRQSVAKLSPLGLSQLRQRLLASIEDLAEKGYFDRYGSLRHVYPERALEGISLPGLERARFRGSMDAVIELADGTVEILDYKTFRSAYSAGLDTCDKRFLETLEPLPEGEELSHSERFAGKLHPAYPTDYQLLLYYLACKQNPEFGQKLSAVALQIIRPGFAENPHQGAIRLAIPGERIEANKQQIIEDINRYIVSPILDSTTFEPNPSQMACANCAYFGICEIGDESELLEDGAE